MSKKEIRFVVVKGVQYLRAEDVVELLLDFGDTEETDVRNRMIELVDNLWDQVHKND